MVLTRELAWRERHWLTPAPALEKDAVAETENVEGGMSWKAPLEAGRHPTLDQHLGQSHRSHNRHPQQPPSLLRAGHDAGRWQYHHHCPGRCHFGFQTRLPTVSASRTCLDELGDLCDCMLPPSAAESLDSLIVVGWAGGYYRWSSCLFSRGLIDVRCRQRYPAEW